MEGGDLCYIITNNINIIPVVILKVSGNIYTIKFVNSKTAIRLPKHRLYKSEEDALRFLGVYKEDSEEQKRGYRAPDRH